MTKPRMKNPGTRPPKNRRVLLVEPDSPGGGSAAAALESLGYETAVEHSEAAAEARLRSDAGIGLALLDVDLDGEDASARLAVSLPAIRDLPVVFLDARPGGPASDRVRDLPRYGYISRNAPPFILRSVLETAFDLFEARNRLSARVRNLDRLNDYSLRLDEQPYEGLRTFALDRLRDLSGAEITAFSGYVPERRELVLEAYSRAEGSKNPAIDFIGRRLLGMRTPLSPENHRRIVEEKVGVMASIHDLSFGRIPPGLGGLAERLVGLGWFRGVSLLSGGELFGTLGLIGPAGSLPPESDELLAFAEITAGALKRKAAERKIQTLLAEKELLLHEVHHRVKNNMATVVGLLDLQSESVEEPAADALREAKSRLQSMGTLYERLYRSDDFREIPLEEYLPDLAAQVVGMFPKGGSVRVETRIEDLRFPVKTVSVLGIIVNELITNALKYAFRDREGGTIRISAVRRGRRAVVEIRDDGAGLPETLDPLATSSFGLRLVRVLTDQLKGTVRFEGRGGTTVTLDLPLPAP